MATGGERAKAAGSTAAMWFVGCVLVPMAFCYTVLIAAAGVRFFLENPLTGSMALVSYGGCALAFIPGKRR